LTQSVNISAKRITIIGLNRDINLEMRTGNNRTKRIRLRVHGAYFCIIFHIT